MRLNQLYRVVTTVMVALVCVMFMTACQDDSPISHTPENGTQDNRIAFSVTVPGYALPTRADATTVDSLITSLHLYLFDTNKRFIGIVEVDITDGTDGPTGEYDKETNDTYPYTANIPQNTDIVHFVANLSKPSSNWINEHKDLTPDQVMTSLVTTEQVYWGQSTFSELKTDDHVVVLYRNYARVEYTKEAIEGSYIVNILGWVLCNVPQNGTVVPFDKEALETNPFHFSLTTEDDADRFATIPFPIYCKELTSAIPVNSEEEADIRSTLTGNADKPMSIFDHTKDDYGQEAYAIFLMETYVDEAKTEKGELYYKIAFRNDDEVLDIKRNHKYVIRFQDINPEFGKTSYALACAGDPANNAYIAVNEILPGLEGDSKTLEVANGTLRYIDDLTTGSYTQVSGKTPKTYTVDDIYINYTGNPTNLKVSWKEAHFGDSYVPETDGSLKIESVGNQTTDDGKAYTHKVSFNADAFNFHDHGENHYKEGLICIAETNGTLSRFVRVYIGDPISFRPLLYSSDIPNLANERISVVFNVPGEEYLPATLYPIEVRFGSDHVDVEKNLQTESMKVEQPATDDYTGVLEWSAQDGTLYYDWQPTGEEDNTWGYKYVYTIYSPSERGQHFVTLRTVDNQSEDFNVMMEGISTVIRDGAGLQKASIFNTRRLPFKMQSAGTGSRRIMLDNGLHETRLVTAYVNAMNTAASINIAYTLGTYNEGLMTQASGTINTTLWVYYDPDKLTPSGTWYAKNTDGTPATKTDPEGNHYVSATVTSAKGTLTFTPVSGATIENTMVFITARSNASTDTDNPYGTYEAGAINHTEKYIHTGVNADADAYRSASVIVSVVDRYLFNQALAVSENENTSIAKDAYTRTDELELNYGKENEHIYLRIDKPINTSGIVVKVTCPTLKLHTGDNNEYLNGFTVLSKDDENGIYYIQLTNDAAAFAYLHFHSNQYVSAGTLTLESVDEAVTVNSTAIPASTVPYDKATVKLTNVPITIPGFAFAREYLLSQPNYFSTGGDSRVNSDAELGDYNLNDYVNKTVIPVKGAHVGIRIFFPGDFIGKLKEEAPDRTFTFRLTTGEYELFYKDCIEEGKATCLPDDVDKYDDLYKYKGLNKGNNTILVQTKVSDLTASTDTRFEGAYYLDLFLRNRTCNPYTEKVYFRSNNEVDEEGNDVEPIKFNTTIASMDRNYRFGDGGYVDPNISQEIGAVLVENSIDNTTFTDANKPLYNVNTSSTVYYKIKLPNVGKQNRGDKRFTITIDDGGKLTNTNTVNDKNIKSITHDADGKHVFTMEVNEPTKEEGTDSYLQYNTEVTLSFTLADDDVKFDEGDSIVVKIDTGETVKSNDYTSVLRGPHELAFDWTATTLDGSALLTNGTYAGSAQGKDAISVSDFAEQLTLTFKNITEEITLSLPEGSLYKFKDGIKSVSITSTSPTVTLVPVTPSSSPDGLSTMNFYSTAELVDGTLKINGNTTSGNTYLANVEVKIRPYLNATTEGLKSLMEVGGEVKLTLTMDDPQHVGKQIDFIPQMGYNDEERTPYSVNGEYFMETKESSHNYSNRIIYSNSSVPKDFTYTVTWMVKNAGGAPVLQMTPQGDTDILSWDKFLTPHKVDLFWPKMNTVGSAKIVFSLEGAGADEKSVAPAEIPFAEGAEITIPQNFTVYKEGYTLTGWTEDGTTTYALGSSVKLWNDEETITLTPVFTKNTVSLNDRAEDITIRWDFQQQNGAPVTGWEKAPVHVWVAQATINGETIDVPMTINTSNGKFNNADWSDWAQIIGGTILTIPSYEGATVRLSGYDTTTSTTIEGNTVTSNSNKIHTYTHSGTKDIIDINIDGSYWKYVEVTLPVEKGINIIPTTDDRPFDLTSGTLNGGIKVESAGNLGYIKDGNTATYTIRNAVAGGDFQMKYEASTKNAGCSIIFSLTGNEVTKTVTKTVENNGSFSTYLPYMWYIDDLPAGDYTLTMTFNTTTKDAYVANVMNIEFVEASTYVGLGTWQSNVTYSNISVKNLDDNTTVYSSGDSWNTQLSTGLYHADDSKSYGNNQLTIADGAANGATAVLNVPIPSDNYELTCRATKTSGNEGFLILFDYLDDDNYKWWNIGGWQNIRHEIQINGEQPTQKSTPVTAPLITNGKLYNITIRVQNGVATCTCVPNETELYYMRYVYGGSYDNASAITEKVSANLIHNSTFDMASGSLATNNGSSYHESATAYKDGGTTDWMQNGNAILYTVYNAAEAKYKISFNAATQVDNVSIEVKLTNESNEDVFNGTIPIENNGNWSDYNKSYSITTSAIPVGRYTLTLTFKNSSTTKTTANLKNISITKQ